MALAPCPSCRRHVDVASEACPFCGAACTGLAARMHPPGRFSRKALVTVASALAIAGCGADDGNVVAMYGAPADVGGETQSDTGSAATDSSSTSDSVSDSGSMSDSSSDSASDAPVDSGFFPPYGHPAWDENIV